MEKWSIDMDRCLDQLNSFTIFSTERDQQKNVKRADVVNSFTFYRIEKGDKMPPLDKRIVVFLLNKQSINMLMNTSFLAHLEVYLAA